VSQKFKKTTNLLTSDAFFQDWGNLWCPDP